MVYDGLTMQALGPISHRTRALEQAGAAVLTVVVLAGCSLFAPSAATPSPTPTASPTSAPGGGPPEAILLLEPGPASRVTSPVRVAGIANPTFEQNLVVRILLVDGGEVALSPTTIQAELGQRGPFEVEIPFSIAEPQNAFIQVYDQSARDGGTIHLATVGVILAPSGPEEIVPVEPHPEVIQILDPPFGAQLSGGVAHVEGFGLASFEQTLVVEVYGEEGDLLGSVPIIVGAPDLGFPGPFEADVAYSVGTEQAGRIVVRDPSPAFAGDIHVSSVEVRLLP